MEPQVAAIPFKESVDIDLGRARLVDPALEAEFLTATLAERRRQTSILLSCIAVISLLAMIPDALVLGDLPGLESFNRLLSIIFSLLSLGLALAAWKSRHAGRLNLLLSIWWLAAIATVCIGNTSYPAESNLFMVFDILIPVAIYVLFPISLQIQAGLAAVFTLLDFSVFANGHSLQPGDSAFIAVAFVAAHVIGIVTCWYLHVSRRQQFFQQRKEQQQRRKAETLLEEIKMLRGILPICSYCKDIRDDRGYWHEVEKYIATHSEADFTHGICPDCMAKHFPQEFARLQATESPATFDGS